MRQSLKLSLVYGLNDFRKHIGFYGRKAGTQLILLVNYNTRKKTHLI